MHLRRRRKALGLFQAQAAQALGVCQASVWNWENEKAEPEDKLFPAIIRFLGYEPWPTPLTLPERLRAERRRRGISMEAAAELMGVAHGALANWESGLSQPSASNRKRMETFLGS
jgi:transcriptional regulator with XRE-family HTH domain